MPRDCVAEIEIGGASGHVELIETRAAREKKTYWSSLVENESSRERRRFALPQW